MNIACGQVYEVVSGDHLSRFRQPPRSAFRRRKTQAGVLHPTVRIASIGSRSVIGPATVEQIPADEVSVVDLYAGGLALHRLLSRQVESQIRSGNWQLVDGDPILVPFEKESDVPPQYRSRCLEAKERRKEALRPLLCLGANALQDFHRIRATTEAVNSAKNPKTGQNVSRAFISKIFGMLLRAGGNDNILMAQHVFAGNISFRERLNLDLPLPQNRPGPMRRLAKRARDAGSSKWDRSNGCATSEQLYARLKLGLNKYLFTNLARARSGRIRLPWNSALQKMRGDPQVLASVAWRTDSSGNKVRCVIALPKGKAPSVDQLRTIAQADPDVWERIKRIKGETDAERNNRPLTNDVRSIAFGPGSRYELDWTVADAWVTSDIDDLPCGRPNVCFVRDVWSRMIVGIHVTMADADYRESAMALYIAFSPKAPFAARWGVKISNAQWDVEGVCDDLGIDNGEFANHLSSVLSRKVTDLQFAGSGRADHKAIVECGPRLMNLGVLRFITGRVAMQRAREEQQPKDAATIRFSVLVAELIKWVVFRQNRRPLARMRLDADFRRSRKAPTPNNLWKWGIKHRTGCPPAKPARELIAKLLPEAEALINRRGLWFRGVCFDRPDDSDFQNLKVRAGISGSIKRRISYDENNTNLVLLQPEERRGDPIVVPISEHTREFRDRTFHQVKLHLEDLRLQAEIATLSVDRYDLDQLSSIAAAIKEGEAIIRERFGTRGNRNRISRAQGVAHSKALQTEHDHARERDQLAGILQAPLQSSNEHAPLHPTAVTSTPEPFPTRSITRSMPRWTERAKSAQRTCHQETAQPPALANGPGADVC